MFCIKCGAKLPGGAGFCHKCGARVPIEVAPQRAQPTVNPEASAQNRQTDAPGVTPQRLDAAQPSASEPLEKQFDTGEAIQRLEPNGQANVRSGDASAIASREKPRHEEEAVIPGEFHYPSRKKPWRDALSWIGERLHAVVALAVLAVPLLIYLIGMCVPFMGIKVTEMGETLRVTVSWFGKISAAGSDLTSLLDTSAITAVGVVTLLAFLGYIVFAAVTVGRVGRGQCFANMIAHGVLLIVGIVAVAAMEKAKRLLGEEGLLEGVKLSTGTVGVLVGACLGLAASVAQWLLYVKSYGETEARTSYLFAFLDSRRARSGSGIAVSEAAATADGGIAGAMPSGITQGKSAESGGVPNQSSRTGTEILSYLRAHLHSLVGLGVLILPFIAYLVGMCVPFLKLKLSILGITQTAKFGWLGSIPTDAEELVPFVPRTAATVVGILLLLALISYTVFSVVTAGRVGRRQCLTNVVAHTVFLALGIAAVAIYGKATKDLGAAGMLEGVKVSTGSIGILVGACLGLAASVAQWVLYAKTNGAEEARDSFIWARICAGIRSKYGSDADCKQIFLAYLQTSKYFSVVLRLFTAIVGAGTLIAVIVSLAQPAFVLSGGDSRILISIFGNVSGLEEGMTLSVLPALVPAWLCAVFLCGAYALFVLLNLGGSNKRFWIASAVFGALILTCGIVLAALAAPQARLAAADLLGEGATVGDLEEFGVTYRGAGAPLIWAGAILSAVSVGLAILHACKKLPSFRSFVLGRIAPSKAPYRAYTSLLNLIFYAVCLVCAIKIIVLGARNGSISDSSIYDGFLCAVCICLAVVTLFGILLTLTNVGNTTQSALGQELALGILLGICGMMFLSARFLDASFGGCLAQIPAALRDYTLVAAFSIPIVTIVQQILARGQSGFAGVMRKGWLKWVVFVPLAAAVVGLTIYIVFVMFRYINVEHSVGGLYSLFPMVIFYAAALLVYCLIFFRHSKVKSIICVYCKEQRFRILQTGAAMVCKEANGKLVSLRFFTHSSRGVRAVYDGEFRLKQNEQRQWAVDEVVKLDALAFDPADRAAFALEPERPGAEVRGRTAAQMGLRGSEFTGGAFALFGIRLLSFIVTCITLGIGYPFMLCWKRRWICARTRINGRQTFFDGNGIQLIGKYIGWLLLCIITLGIFSFWLNLRMEAWLASHTHFDDGHRVGESKFSGGILGLIGIKLLTFFVTLVTLGIGSFWAHCKRERWFTKHRSVDGYRLAFDGTGLQYFLAVLKWTLLTIITLGIYSFWLSVRAQRWTVVHTNMSGEAAQTYLTAITPRESVSENVEPESVEPENVESESVESESVEPENVEPENVEPESVESESVKSESMEG